MKATESILVETTTKDGELIKDVFPLPNRIICIYDVSAGKGQFIIFMPQDFEHTRWKKYDRDDCAYLGVTLTNDPYTPHAGGTINLGYYSIRLRYCYGKIMTNNPMTYITDNIEEIMIVPNFPLRHITQYGDSSDKLEFDILKAEPGVKTILDFRFKGDLDKGVLLLYSKYNYIEKRGRFRGVRLDWNSHFNQAQVVCDEEHDTYTALMNKHGLAEKPLEEVEKEKEVRLEDEQTTTTE